MTYLQNVKNTKAQRSLRSGTGNDSFSTVVNNSLSTIQLLAEPENRFENLPNLSGSHPHFFLMRECHTFEYAGHYKYYYCEATSHLQAE